MDSVPTLKQVEAYVDTHIFNIFSKDLFTQHLQERADDGCAEAESMLEGTSAVNAYLHIWCENINVVGRRMDCGLSRLCRVLGEVSPFVSSNQSWFVGTCEISGAVDRPCFHIHMLKPSSQTLTVHHSLLPACQMLWTLVNTPTLLNVCADLTHEKSPHAKLHELCSTWSDSSSRATVTQFLHLACSEVPKVLRCDNNFGHLLRGG